MVDRPRHFVTYRNYSKVSLCSQAASSWFNYKLALANKMVFVLNIGVVFSSVCLFLSLRHTHSHVQRWGRGREREKLAGSTLVILPLKERQPC